MRIFSVFQPGGVDYGNCCNCSSAIKINITISFKAGSRFSMNICIQIVLDFTPEDDEQFRVTFELPGGYRNLKKGEPEEAVITIKDDDAGWTQSVCAVVVIWPTVDPLHSSLYCMYSTQWSKFEEHYVHIQSSLLSTL